MINQLMDQTNNKLKNNNPIKIPEIVKDQILIVDKTAKMLGKDKAQF